MMIDIDICIGCMSCEIACKEIQNIDSLDVKPMKVLRFEGIEKESSFFMPMNCFHCENAPCVLACPTSAMRKREDGIVYVKEDYCIGCKACIIACPFGAITFDPQSFIVKKCNYCTERIDKGLLPACVTKCTTNCLYFIEVEENIKQRHINKYVDKELVSEIL